MREQGLTVKFPPSSTQVPARPAAALASLHQSLFNLEEII